MYELIKGTRWNDILNALLFEIWRIFETLKYEGDEAYAFENIFKFNFIRVYSLDFKGENYPDFSLNNF